MEGGRGGGGRGERIREWGAGRWEEEERRQKGEEGRGMKGKERKGRGET